MTTVAQAREFLDQRKWEIEHEEVYRQCFDLIREMHWGLFRDLNREDFPELWRILVSGDKWHPDVGDLKRKVNTASLYCGLIDIHAYTDFCQRNKLNFSMIEMLDSMIQREIREIARKNRCIARRTGGDMIILVGADAGQLIRTVLGVIDFFSVRRMIKSRELSETRTGFQVAMPDLYISGGITGGLAYSSIVITQDGDLSGSIVNTASRLQSFAGIVSPTKSTVIVTAQVHTALRGEGSRESERNFAFFNYGRVMFKGIDVPVLEVLYSEPDFHKLGYQHEYTTLLKTINKGLLRERLLPDMLALVERALEAQPGDRASVRQIERALREILDLWEAREGLERLGERLAGLKAEIDRIERFDRVVGIYLQQTAELFERIGRDYEYRLTEAVLAQRASIFASRERRILRLAERLSILRARLLERGRAVLPEAMSRKTWNAVLDRFASEWKFEIYSGKR